MSSATTIRIRDLVKSFPAPGGGTTKAVDRVTLTIEAGELFFLLGPSGCGKTTLLRMIAGFIEPTGGSILFEDPAGSRDVTFVAPNRRNTGMVFQSYALWPHMTIEQNVAFGLDLRKISASEKKRRVFEALAVVQMEDYAARRPTQLSGGQQQRVALARALVIRPSVLLLDEPLSNLDAKLRNDLRSEIRRICKQAELTGVYVTHDQKEALSMADRIAIMRAGRLIQTGTPDGLYRSPKSRFVSEFLGDTNLIPGEVASAAMDRIAIRTAAGLLGATTSIDEASVVKVGAKVLCSIRPEAWRVLTSPTAGNTLAGRHVDTTFLGEIAHHTIELAGNARVRMTELNPKRGAIQAGSSVSLSVDPADVVLVPDVE